MSINSIENATRYSNELDRMFTQKSVTGFFADNALSTKFVGAKTVIIPDIDFQGLANYDRDTGFERGAIAVSNASYTMSMDRARSLQIDREDLTETGVANLAGKILGEYVRTKVVPECDAYVLSKLAAHSRKCGNYVVSDYRNTSPLSVLLDLVKEVQAVVGFDEELVAFVNNTTYANILNNSDLTKQLIISEFKQGDVNLQVKSFNGIPIIPVVSDRMKTDYDFNPSGVGGFAPKNGSREIHMLVCPKKAAHLVKKTENMRIFTPEQNLDADAYKFDYRIYYDVFVPKSTRGTIWSWLSPTLSITEQPIDLTVVEGEIADGTSVTATSNSGEIAYQWYSCENKFGGYPIKLTGETSETFSVPEDLTKGTYYYFAEATVNGTAAIKSRIITVTVE